MVALYDKLPLHEDILLDLPFREGVRELTGDISLPRHPVTLYNTPSWISLPSGLGVVDLDGANQYLQCLSADCLDLDFVAGDYSISGWVYWNPGATSQIIMGRYQVDNDGWELYLTNIGAIDYLTIRHHHSGTIVDGHPRTAGNSVGWAHGVWHHFGLARSGKVAPHYRNGIPLDMTYSTGGLVDPESNNNDLVIGTRTTKDANWLVGRLGLLKVWGRALTAKEFRLIYELERGWYP